MTVQPRGAHLQGLCETTVITQALQKMIKAAWLKCLKRSVLKKGNALSALFLQAAAAVCVHRQIC